MITRYPRETKEFVPVGIALDGVATTSGVEFCITVDSDRPVTWIAPVALSGLIGVMIDHLPIGMYTVWARVTDSPEIPVLSAGRFQIT